MMSYPQRVVALIILTLLFTVNGSWSWGGTTPPFLLRLTASTPVHAGETVTLTARLIDFGSGVNPAWLNAILLDPEGGGQINVRDWTHVSGWTYVGQAVIGHHAVPGVWKVHSLLAYDRNRNGKFYNFGERHRAQFQVINPNPDRTPPVMTSVSVSPNPGILNSPITVTIGVRDDVSGVDLENLFVNLTHEGGQGHSQVKQWTSVGPNTYRGTTTLNPRGQPGRWIVHSVFVRDLAGNAVNLAHGKDYSYTFWVNNPVVPDIYLEPNHQQKAVGEVAQFHVAAVGVPSPSYQWRRNGINIPGARSTSYVHRVVSSTENGDEYDVVVFNIAGAVTSRIATLRVGNGNYQGILASQVPDVWYRLDNNLNDSGALGGDPLQWHGGDFGRGGRFGFDFENIEKLAYFTSSGQDLMYQSNNIIENVGSLSMLIKTPDASLTKNRHIINYGTASPNAFHFLYAEPNMTFKIGNVNITLDKEPILQNQWHYFGVSWNIPSGTVHWAYGPLGGSIATGSRGVSTNANAGNRERPFLLANREFRAWENWGGGIDEVAIWNRNLSANDLIAQFAALTSPSGSVSVISHPASQAVIEGATAHFSVRAFGPPPYFYQWMKNGVPIVGATNDNVSLVGVGFADQGALVTAIISNEVGTATSLPATLTVAPARLYQETVLSHLPDYWFPLDNTLAGFGTQPIEGLTSIGRFVRDRLPEGVDNLGNLNAAFNIVGGFDHVAQATDMVHDRGSFSMLFRTPDIPFEDSNRHVFSQGGSPAASNALSLRFSPANLSLLVGSVSTPILSGQPLQDTWYYFALAWDIDRQSDQVTWHLGPLDLPLESGTVTLGPSDVLGSGDTMYFGNRASNQFDNALKEGSSSGTVDEIAFWLRELSLEEIQLQHATHRDPHTGPSIAIPPANTVVGLGEPASFSVTAFGVGPLTYQWLSNGVVYAGATNALLEIPSTTVSMSNDQYRVIVADNFGSITSSVGVLSVAPVFVITHPASRTVPDGATGHFTVEAAGLAPLLYQWRINGVPLPGATNAALNLIGVTEADNGALISVVISNALGTATSSPATLTVTPSRLYQQTVLSHLPDYWFPLDNTLAGFGTQPIEDLTSIGRFVRDRLPEGVDNLGSLNAAFDIVGGFDHVAQATDMVHDRGSFSMLFRTPDIPFEQANRHVFSQGGSPAASNALTLRFSPANLSLLVGSVSTPILSGQPLQDAWYYFALTWDLDRPSDQVIWHLGPLDLPLESGTVTLGPSDVLGSGDTMYFGNRASNQFDNALKEGSSSGTVDEIAFWLRELSLEEIQLQHQSHTVPYTGPTIVQSPLDMTVDAGSPAFFGVTATGIGTLTYQWLSNGVVYAGATNAMLTIPSVTTSMSNNQYRAIVSDGFGSVTSGVATLSVIPPPPNLEETLTALNPDYWFRFNSDLTNSGDLPAADFNASGTSFGTDAFGATNQAIRINAANASLEQADLLGPSGTLTMLFRTPDAPLLFAHLFAQGVDNASSNAFNVVHVDFTGLRLRAGDESVLIHAGVLPVSRWYFLALSWDEDRDAGEVHWWLGNVGGTLTGGVLDIGDDAVIGDGGSWFLGNNSVGGFNPWRRDDGTVHPGSIDEVALWTSELAVESISNLFVSSAIGGPKFNVIIGDDIKNGNFDADTSNVDSRNFGVTPFWQNIGTTAPDQAVVATRTNQPFDGTRNAQITDNPNVALGMDTGYFLSEGDVFDVSYVWLDGFNWHDPSDRIAVTLFVTDDNTISGTRTEMATSLSMVSSMNSSYEVFEDSGFYIAESSVAGKLLFVKIDGVDGNGNPNGFARMDNFVLTATTPGGGGGVGMGFALPLMITQMRVAATPTGELGIELNFDTQPFKHYTIDWKDSLTTSDWKVADTIVATNYHGVWFDAGDIETGRASPLDLPTGNTRSYRLLENP